VKKVIVVVVLVALFWVNFGFTVQPVSAYDPWGRVWKWSQDGMGNMSWGGASMSSPGFQQWGYNYASPWSGPSFPGGGAPCTLGMYNYTWGPPIGYGSGGGWDGYAYGTFSPGSYGLYGVYGYNMPNPFHN
jgi:hypothetical protein